MSLDISVSNEETGESRDMNWLRNPYGLERWAEMNFQYAARNGNIEKPPQDLWYVVNHWSYGDSAEVDRALFKQVVDAYWRVIEPLEHGYFWFDAASLLQFVVPHLGSLPRDTRFGFDMHRFKDGVFHEAYAGIPQGYFTPSCFHLSNPSLGRYKAWFSELVEFAEILQDPHAVFFCSN